VTPGVNHPGKRCHELRAAGAGQGRSPRRARRLGGFVEGAGELVQVTQEAKAPFKVAASRPMCLYPSYPRYKGEGDPNEARASPAPKQ